ncbi:hypothetical protein [Amylibacter sp. IMCC11727]|uniref:hypothetical protein n=1 Tax=Amylibacter sp. IMCC11727 TaxID=3039851 RepID=UPI00244DF73D|nr:hypothetical protein [Amylibacter sp. IMCC11727]WGI20784.1 hypothetical protein QBD29_11765 [Amylibacter sp. IMCC11727]
MKKWLRANLFRNWFDGLVTVALVSLLGWAALAVFEWAVVNAVWDADSQLQCYQIIRERQGNGESGACWAAFKGRSLQFVFGFYPEELYWRPTLAVSLLPFALLPIFVRSLCQYLIWFTVCYPIIAYVLIFGALGLEEVPISKMGGFMLVLMLGVASSGIAVAVGILLALGQTFGILPAQMVIKAIVAVFDRIPVVILLYVVLVLLNYMLPLGFIIDSFPRLLLVLGLVCAAPISKKLGNHLVAILAENIEAATSLGFSRAKAYWIIVFPAAFARALPNIMDELAEMFRHIAIVSMLGFANPLLLVNNIRADVSWNGVYLELFIPVAIVFWIMSFSLTSYGSYLKRRIEWRSTRLMEEYN